MEDEYLYHLEFKESDQMFHYNTDPQKQQPFTFGWRTLMHCETLDELCDKFERLDKKMKPNKKYTQKELQKILKHGI